MVPGSGQPGKPAAGPYQDAAVAQLLRTIESLQHQQEVAEAARLVADGDAQLAFEGMASMELQLHAGKLALTSLAGLDDAFQAAQLELDVRLQEKAAKQDLLKRQAQALSTLRGKAEALDELCEQKGLIVEELRARLLAGGTSEAQLKQLEAEAALLSAPSHDSFAVLEDPDAEITLFVPVLTNITALQAAEFPQLLPNLVLPKVYPTAADLLAAAPLTNLFNSTVTLTNDPKLGVFHAVFVEAGNATADIFPIAFRIGKSVAYLITPLTAGKLPVELNDV
ncbi:hypothetical protein N2152v2_000472 [Parachlorella kessleri]